MSNWNNNQHNYNESKKEDFMDGDIGREFGWDDEINEDPKEFITLVPGEYQFTVTEVEKSRYEGGEKLPPCPMAIVTCKISTPQGDAFIKNRLYLHSKTEGLLSSFFASIGLKKKGEPLRMQWNKVIGATGRAKVGIRQYQGNDYNDIKSFLAPDGYNNPAAGQQQSWGQGKY